MEATYYWSWVGRICQWWQSRIVSAFSSFQLCKEKKSNEQLCLTDWSTNDTLMSLSDLCSRIFRAWSFTGSFCCGLPSLKFPAPAPVVWRGATEINAVSPLLGGFAGLFIQTCDNLAWRYLVHGRIRSCTINFRSVAFLKLTRFCYPYSSRFQQVNFNISWLVFLYIL